MYTLDKQDPPQLMARAKPWWVFTILSVIAIACASCNNAAQQTSQPRGRTVQSPRVTVAVGMPLTDSAPPQRDVTPTVSVSAPQSMQLATTPIATPGISYEAESPQNTLAGGAAVIGCTNDAGCSGGLRVGHIGFASHPYTDGTLQFNNIAKKSGGGYTLTIYYILAGLDKLTLYTSVNGGPEMVLNVARTANGDTVGRASIAINLNAGNNTIEFSNSSDPASDIDRIVV